MKPIYKSLALDAMTLQVSLALSAQTYDGETTSKIDVPAEVLESLRVELIAPNVSGARDLIKSGECVIDGSDLSVTLNARNWVKGATYRVQVVATLGTQTQVIYALNVTVPYYEALSDTPQEYEDDVTVVSTIGDGAGSQITVDPTPTENSNNPVASGGVYLELKGKANGSIYKVGESGNPAVQNVAKIHGHSIELSNNCEATGLNAVAMGTNTKATGNNSHAEGVKTKATGGNSHAEGCGIIDTANGPEATGRGAHAEGITTHATNIGSHAEGYQTTASGSQSHAEGSSTVASGVSSHAEGSQTTASGAQSHAEGLGTIASGANQMVIGKYNDEDTDGDYAFIVGNGENDEIRGNAFAIDWNGNLVLFNAGTPVVLTPAKLAQLIA